MTKFITVTIGKHKILIPRKSSRLWRFMYNGRFTTDITHIAELIASDKLNAVKIRPNIKEEGRGMFNYYKRLDKQPRKARKAVKKKDSPESSALRDPKSPTERQLRIQRRDALRLIEKNKRDAKNAQKLHKDKMKQALAELRYYTEIKDRIRTRKIAVMYDGKLIDKELYLQGGGFLDMNYTPMLLKILLKDILIRNANLTAIPGNYRVEFNAVLRVALTTGTDDGVPTRFGQNNDASAKDTPRYMPRYVGRFKLSALADYILEFTRRLFDFIDDTYDAGELVSLRIMVLSPQTAAGCSNNHRDKNEFINDNHLLNIGSTSNNNCLLAAVKRASKRLAKTSTYASYRRMFDLPPEPEVIDINSPGFRKFCIHADVRCTHVEIDGSLIKHITAKGSTMLKIAIRDAHAYIYLGKYTEKVCLDCGSSYNSRLPHTKMQCDRKRRNPPLLKKSYVPQTAVTRITGTHTKPYDPKKMVVIAKEGDTYGWQLLNDKWRKLSGGYSESISVNPFLDDIFNASLSRQSLHIISYYNNTFFDIYNTVVTPNSLYKIIGGLGILTGDGRLISLKFTKRGGYGVKTGKHYTEEEIYAREDAMRLQLEELGYDEYYRLIKEGDYRANEILKFSKENATRYDDRFIRIADIEDGIDGIDGDIRARDLELDLLPSNLGKIERITRLADIRNRYKHITEDDQIVRDRKLYFLRNQIRCPPPGFSLEIDETVRPYPTHKIISLDQFLPNIDIYNAAKGFNVRDKYRPVKLNLKTKVQATREIFNIMESTLSLLQDEFGFEKKMQICDVDTISSVAYKLWKMTIPDDMSIHCPTEEMHKFIKVYGGKTWIKQREFMSSSFNPNTDPKDNYANILENNDYLQYLDVNSQYPYVMKEMNVPISQGIFEDDPTRLQWLLDNPTKYQYYIKCDIYPPQDITEPLIPEDKDGRMIWNLKDKKDAIITSMDILTGRLGGYEFKNPTRALYYEETSKVFEPYINKVFTLKKNSEPGAMRTFCKLLLNGLFGKLCQKPRFTEQKLCSSFIEYSNFYDNYSCAEPIYINDDTVILVGESTDPAVRARSLLRPRHIGGFITASARNILASYQSLADKSFTDHKYYYSDTDSLLVSADVAYKIYDEYTNDNIGSLKDEYPDKVIFRYTAFAPKSYALFMIDPEGVISHKITSKGIPTGIITPDQLDALLAGIDQEVKFSGHMQHHYKKSGSTDMYLGVTDVTLSRTISSAGYRGAKLVGNKFYPYTN